MIIKGVFGLPSIRPETNEKYKQPIPTAVVTFVEDGGEEYEMITSSLGRYEIDLPVGFYSIEAYIKGDSQAVSYIRQGMKFIVTKDTKENAFDEWLMVGAVRDTDPVLKQWLDVLYEMRDIRINTVAEIDTAMGDLIDVKEDQVKKIKTTTDSLISEVIGSATSTKSKLDVVQKDTEVLREKLDQYEVYVENSTSEVTNSLNEVKDIEVKVKTSEASIKSSEANVSNLEKAVSNNKTSVDTSLATIKKLEASAKASKEVSETSAKASESSSASAKSSATTATTKAKEATTAASNAKESENSSSISANNAKESEGNAKTSEVNAKASESESKRLEEGIKEIHKTISNNLLESNNSAKEAKVSETKTKEYMGVALSAKTEVESISSKMTDTVNQTVIVFDEKLSKIPSEAEAVGEGKLIRESFVEGHGEKIAENKTIAEESLKVAKDKWDVQTTVGSGHIVRKSEVDAKQDKLEFVGDGKVLREGSAKRDFLSTNGAYHSSSSGNIVPFNRGDSGVALGGKINNNHESLDFDKKNLGSTFLYYEIQATFADQERIATFRELRGSRIFTAVKRRDDSHWSNFTEILTDKNTTTDKSGVLHSGAKTPLDTLNVSDMCDTVVDRDDITVTSGAVYRAVDTASKALSTRIDSTDSKAINAQSRADSAYNLAANALTESDRTSSLGTSTTLVATQKLVNDVKSQIETDIKIQIESVGLPSEIFMFYQSNVPTGFIELAGQEISTEYPILRATFGDNLPDLRGRFPRMSGGNGGSPKQLQGDAIRNITGRITVYTSRAGGNSADGAFYEENGGGKGESSQFVSTRPRFVFDASRVVPTANENRPINFSALFCVKLQ